MAKCSKATSRYRYRLGKTIVFTFAFVTFTVFHYLAVIPFAIAQNNPSGDEYVLDIWPENSEISERWYTEINTRICPDPEIPDLGEEESQIRSDSETGEPVYPGSQIVVSYVATMLNGTSKSAEYEYISSANDLCSVPITHNFGFLEPGNWSIHSVAMWVSTDGVSIQHVESNMASVTVKPALYSSTNSQTVGLNANSYPLLKLLDWSSDGKSILVAYDNTFNSSIGFDPTTTPSNETGVLGIMDPQGDEIRILQIPTHFRYFTDARFSPSNDDVLLIIGSAYEFENQATVFRYDLQDNELVPLPEIKGYAVWVPDKDGDGNDDIVFGKEIRDGSEQDSLIEFEIWLADSNGRVTNKLYQQSVSDEAGFQIDDSSTDGNEVLITIHKHSPVPISVKDLAIFNVQDKSLHTILFSQNIASARLAPFDDLVLYNIGPGYKTPAGPLYIMTTDGSYHEQLEVGQRPGTVDSPASFVISPDGRLIVAAIQIWGSGELYITKTELAHPIPEFDTTLVSVTIITSLAGSAAFRYYIGKKK